MNLKLKKIELTTNRKASFYKAQQHSSQTRNQEKISISKCHLTTWLIHGHFHEGWKKPVITTNARTWPHLPLTKKGKHSYQQSTLSHAVLSIGHKIGLSIKNKLKWKNRSIAWSSSNVDIDGINYNYFDVKLFKTLTFFCKRSEFYRTVIIYIHTYYLYCYFAWIKGFKCHKIC